MKKLVDKTKKILWKYVAALVVVLILLYGFSWHFDLPINKYSNVGLRTGLKNGPVWKKLSKWRNSCDSSCCRDN
jgi:hypothetical protein